MYSRRHNRVSVVVTNYNNEKYIEECLDSLRRQTYRDLEIIVVDDASTDNSFNIIQSWEKKYQSHLKHRVKVIQLPRNVGYAGALNVGLYLAKGEYIAMQDGDDISHPKRIEMEVNFLAKHKSYDLVGTNYVAFENGDLTQIERAYWLGYGEEIPERYAKGDHCICHGTILFRGKVFDKFGGPRRHHEGAEDYDILARYITKGVVAENLPDVLYYYRSHSSQRSHLYYGHGRSRGEK
jgi:glycosyltransferase involved in cell wall biosynthesis